MGPRKPAVAGAAEAGVPTHNPPPTAGWGGGGGGGAPGGGAAAGGPLPPGGPHPPRPGSGRPRAPPLAEHWLPKDDRPG